MPVPGGPTPLVRRLPLLVVAALGIWLWRSSLFPQERTLVWDRPNGPSVISAEVQLWRDDALLARAEWPDARAGVLTQTLSLREGPLRALSVVRLSDGSTRQGAQDLRLGGDAVLHVALVPPGARRVGESGPRSTDDGTLTRPDGGR